MPHIRERGKKEQRSRQTLPTWRKCSEYTNLPNDELSPALVENTLKLLVQDHLGQFLLHSTQIKVNELGQVSDLHAGVWFDETQQILLQEGLREAFQVCANEVIVHQLHPKQGTDSTGDAGSTKETQGRQKKRE